MQGADAWLQVPIERLNEICQSMSEVEIAAGDRLIRQGRKNEMFYIVNKASKPRCHPPGSMSLPVCRGSSSL